uniref:Uncharacterized protein n=1 Tax=Anopheles melas TaxID=34690 RepID=A0A182U1K9_9DIPT
MPKLWQMDDYDECLESPGPDEPPGVYCSLSVVLKPNNRSELWKLIEYKFDDGILEDIPTYRAAYQDVLEICVNKELNDTYGLVAYTDILSCDKSTDEVVIVAENLMLTVSIIA